MERLLICGDSFSISDSYTWVESLRSEYDVTNVSQAGASEYRIWLQWFSKKSDRFDRALICHTSYTRIYSERNFFHDPQGKHNNCDLLYLDVKSHLPKPEAEHIVWFFENIFDLDQAKFHYDLLLKHWLSVESKFPITHVSFFENTMNGVYDYSDVWKNHPGTFNHLSPYGNQEILKRVKELLRSNP